MKNYNPIANGYYINEHVEILKDLNVWYKMTNEEKSLFKPCNRCKTYNEYAARKDNTACPCQTCEHRKTEIQIDNRMITLREKYK